MKRARENLEIRVLSTGKGWRVDAVEIGADVTRTGSRWRSREGAIGAALELAAALRAMDNYGTVRLMVETQFTVNLDASFTLIK